MVPAQMTEIVIREPGGPEVLVPRTTGVPVPGAGEVLVRVRAAGVNRADLLQRQGRYALPPGALPGPGLEIAGEIAALGPQTERFGWSIGQAVCALTNGGGYAEYCAVPAGQVLPLPEGLTMVEAGAAPETAFTVWSNLVQMGHARPGETVLVHGGTSGIGTTTLMFCRELGLRALATAGSERKCAAIRALGAEAINYREQDFAETARALTQGRGVDILLDIVGGKYASANLAALARGGRWLLIGLQGGARAEQLDLQAIMQKRVVLTGATLRGRSDEEKAVIAEQLRRNIWPALAQGRCRPIVHSTFPLAEAAEAHRTLEGGEPIGKLVLTVG